jgi:serine/threonine protein kinase
VERKLGQGSFGVVYKVIDTLGDVPRTVKLISVTGTRPTSA